MLALVEAAICQRKNLAAHRAKVYVAAEYAAYCRSTGVELGLVTAEFSVLREAFWRVLQESDDLDAHRKTQAIVWIDVAFSLVTRASMLGYYKPELESRGQWPAVLDKIARDSPLLAPSR